MLAISLLLACAATPPAVAPPNPAQIANAFAARTLDQALPDLPMPASAWDRAQWLRAALALNPQLAEMRAQLAAVAAAERTAAQRPNPQLSLSAEYAVSGPSAWLFGLALDFLLQRPGERARLQANAALRTQAVQSELAQSLWQLRMDLRAALLDVVCTREQTALLLQLQTQRAALLAAARNRVDAGAMAASELLSLQLDLAAVRQRQSQTLARATDARLRLASVLGVPAAALDGVAPQWPDWAAIDTLGDTFDDTPGGASARLDANQLRAAALIGRPQMIRALREYDLAENAVQAQVAQRWPEVHVAPGYTWDHGAIDNSVGQHEAALGVGLAIPLFNHNEGPIAEALAQRVQAGKHVEAVQAQLFAQIDHAQAAWPLALQVWRDARDAAVLAQHQLETEQHALAAGESDRPAVLAATVAASEAQLRIVDSAAEAQSAFGALEDAYRRPLQGPETGLPEILGEHQ